MSYRALDVSAVLERLGYTDLVPSKVAYDGTVQSALPISVACSGPLQVSSSKALAIDYPLIWDVNGYYRDLGIAAPYRPTRKDLREAYQGRGGPDDVRLTYVLKQLLNDDVRHRYDRMPLGSVFDDEYEWAKLDKISALWAGEQTAATGELHTVADFHRAHGMSSTNSRSADSPYGVRHLSGDWPFAFYLWNSRTFDDQRLLSWQKMIVDAAWNRGLRISFAVGYVGQTDERWDHLTGSDGTQIFFLNEAVVPQCDDAEEALDRLAPRTTAAPPHHTQTTPPHTQYTPSTNPIPLPESTPMTDTATEETIELDFARGGLAAQERAKAEAEARKAGRGNNEFLSSVLKADGDTCLIRFITDDGPEGQNIYVDQHYVPTKAAPSDKPSDANWPDRRGAVCRYTKIGPPDKQRAAFKDCYICDIMRNDKGKRYPRSTRGWAIAVIRKEVVGTQAMVDEGRIQANQVGVVVGYIDDTVEVDELGPDEKPTGQKVTKKHFVVINLGMKNFWNKLIPFFKRYGTLLDRDYEITRSGEGTDTDYAVVSLDPILKPVRDEDGNPTGQTEVFDLRNPKYAVLYADHGIKISEIISRQIAKPYYDRYFDPRVETKWAYDDEDDSGPSSSASTTKRASEPNPDSATAKPTGANADKMAAMRAKLLGDNPGQEATANAGGMIDYS